MSKSISKNAVFKTVLNISNIILPIIVMPFVLDAIQPQLNGYISVGENYTALFMIFASFGIYRKIAPNSAGNFYSARLSAVFGRCLDFPQGAEFGETPQVCTQKYCHRISSNFDPGRPQRSDDCFGVSPACSGGNQNRGRKAIRGYRASH